MQLSPEPQDQLHEPETQNGNLEPSDNIQEEWEDVSDAEQLEVSQRDTSLNSSASGSQAASSVSLRKKRRVQTKATFVASPTPPKVHAAKAQRKKAPIVRQEELQEALTDSVRFTTSYAFDVFRGSVEKMRKPLSWFLFLWMFAWMVSFLTPTLRTAFSPLCIFPGISRSALCAPIRPPSPVNFEKLVNIQGSTFEQLAGESAGGSELSIEVLRAEMATQDLSLLVRFSDLKSRDNIADMLRTVAADAKKTGRGLTKLNAKVVGAIDEVMALNNYAMATIEGAHKKAPSPLLQAISPYKLGPTAEEIIVEAFTIAMDESEQTFEKLIIEADTSRRNLEQMDVDIGALHEMIAREDKHTTAETDKVLGELWTRLGGNKKVVRDFKDRLALLNDLGEYRKKAYAHVMAALRTLHTMSDDLEVLRERVAAPTLLGGKLPLHVHIESIKNGLERLQEGRVKSRGRGIEEETARINGSA